MRTKLTRTWTILGAATLALSLGGAAIAAAGESSDDAPPVKIERVDIGERSGSYRIPGLNKAPAPAELLDTTRATLDCFEGHGLRVFGPFPSPDGRSMLYSTEDGQRFAEADAACTPPQLSAVAAFEAQATEQDHATMRTMRADLIGCLVSKAPELRRGLTTKNPLDVNEALIVASSQVPNTYAACLSA